MESSSFELTQEILDQFKMESRENLGNAEAALHLIEKSNEAGEAIHELFRSIHTIKGSSDYLGFIKLKELSHSFENILDQLRKIKSSAVTSEQLDVFFNVLDVMSDLVTTAPQVGDQIDHSCKKWIEELERFEVDETETMRVPKNVSDAVVQNSNHGNNKTIEIFRDTVEQQLNALLRAQVKLKSDQSIDPVARGMVSRALQCVVHASQFIGEEDLSNLSSHFKDWVLSPLESKDVQEFIIKIDHYIDQAKENLRTIFDRTEKVQEQKSVVSSIESYSLKESKTVRVDQSALDGFMNLVGELIVARNTFSHIQSKLLGTEDDRLIALKEFRESANRLTHITGVLQRNVMEMRMVPIKTLFLRYPRIVRDVCRKNGKSAEVVFEGEDTEVDKGIADQISESLIHLVRNAVDHGIESAEERKKLGKSEVGKLILKASHQGNFMVIEVTDDGAGLPVDKIRSKIVEKGILSSEEVEKISRSEILDYIFSPGFSTAAAVTDISGRGVGLDVVKTNLKKVKGSVTVSTEVNQGTCFRLEVPLTMTIMRALLVKANQSIYAFSLHDVTETVKMRRDELQSICQKSAMTLRGEVIRVDWLSDLLGESLQRDLLSDFMLSILILEGSGKKFGVIIDSVFKQEEIVVKPLPDSYVGLPGLSGASILGDGRAILILDSSQLYGLMSVE